MAGVFISYARVDAPIAAQVRTLLELYLGPGTTFLDTSDLDPGDVWRERIRREIDGATLFLALVSVEWHASRYCQAERVLAVGRHPALRVVPIPVGAGIRLDDLEVFAVHQAPTTVPLQRGLGTEELRATLEPLLKRVRDTMERPPCDEPRPPPRPPLRPPAGPQRTDDPLRRGHGADLRVTFDRQRGGWRCTMTIEGAARGAWDVTDSSLRSPSTDLAVLGDALGHALLAGADRAWHTDLLGGPLKSHRCRILSDDPSLLALPWRLARLRNEWLVCWGWTFELADPDTLHADCRLGVNTRNLLLLPRSPAQAPPPDDVALRTLLHGHGRHEQLIVVARDWREVQAAVAVHPRPAMVVVVADPADSSVLVDDEDDDVMLPDRTCSRLCHPDDTLLLVLIGRTRPLIPQLAWLPKAATIVWSTLTPGASEAETMVRHLLSAIVEHGCDPVWAVEHAAALGTPAACALNVWTRWGTWTTDLPATRPSHAGAVLRELDREHARAAARDAVGQLVRNALGVRCLVLLGTADAADPDLLPEELPRQIRDDLRERDKEVGLVKRTLVPPPEGMATDRFEADLERQLAAPTGSSRADHLRQMTAPQSHRAHPVLWLEPPRPLSNPTPERVVAWLGAFDHAVGRHVPSDRHVVLCCVLLADDPDQLLTRIDSALTDDHLIHTQVRPLDPIGVVRREEIVSFLSRTDVSACPTGKARAVAAQVFARTQGNFRQTVELLEVAENDRYATILRALESKPR